MQSRVGEKSVTRWQLRFQQIASATIALAVLGVATRGITLFTQIIIAQKFGLTNYTDAYFVTEKLPELFIDLITIGFSMVFIPIFTNYRITLGEERAQIFASSFILLCAFLSIVLAIFTMVGTPLIVTIFAPGFVPETREIAINLVRIISIAIFFFGLDASMRGLLQANRRFVLPELGRVLYNLTLFIFALFLTNYFGIYALAWGIVCGAILQFAFQFIGVHRQKLLKLTWVFDKDGIVNVVKQLVPFMIALSGVEIVIVIDRMIASGLVEGDLTALNYASRIVLLPVGIVAIPLRTTMYPGLSQLAAQHHFQELADVVFTGMKVLLFFVTPICVALAVLRFPVTKMLFERGAFDQFATYKTGIAVAGYATAVSAIAVVFLLNNVFLSLGSAMTLVKLNIVTWVSNFILSYILATFLGYVGIALATGIIMTLLVLAMLKILKTQHLPDLSVHSLWIYFFQVAAISAVMGLLLSGILTITNQFSYVDSFFMQFFQIAMLIGVGSVIYFGLIRLFKVDGFHMLASALKKIEA